MIFIDDKVYCDFSSDGYRLPTNREWLFAAIDCLYNSQTWRYVTTEKS